MSEKNSSTKLRETYTPDIIDEVIAFANADGGVIYIGIREDNTVLGLPDPHSVAAFAAQDILSSVQPDISAVVQVRTVLLQGKELVAVMVGRGTSKPYSRIGAPPPTAEAKPAAVPIVPMLGCFSEAAPCNAQLSFSSLALAMESSEIPADEQNLISLGITNADGRFTQLALLLSEQCPYNLRLTLYDGCDKSSIKYSGTISGSLLRQLAETSRLVEKLAPRCYPADSVSEAILNALVHRDYSFSGSTLVNLFDDRVEILSPGGLVQGISLSAVDMGISQPRNPMLAAALCRMELMECCGSGIGRIRSLYSRAEKAPMFDAAEGGFRVTLPNLSTAGEKTAAPDGYKALVLEHAKEKGFVVRSDVEQLAGLKTTAAYNLIKELVADGMLIPSGVGKKTIYKLP